MPSTLFQKISEIIKTDFKNTFAGGNVILQDSTSKPVKINKTGSFLCIQPDKKIRDWKNNFPFFETSIEELCSVSDHIIVYPKTDVLYIFIVELKTTNPTGAIKQVRANYELGKSNGTYNAVYDADVMNTIQTGEPFARIHKIPGSWRDW